MPHLFETATTARSKCRGCGEKISAGELQLRRGAAEPVRRGRDDALVPSGLCRVQAAGAAARSAGGRRGGPARPRGGLARPRAARAGRTGGRPAPAVAADRRRRARADGPRRLPALQGGGREGGVEDHAGVLRGCPLLTRRLRPRRLRASVLRDRPCGRPGWRGRDRARAAFCAGAGRGGPARDRAGARVRGRRLKRRRLPGRRTHYNAQVAGAASRTRVPRGEWACANSIRRSSRSTRAS
jgi:hypothetical protein